MGNFLLSIPLQRPPDFIVGRTDDPYLLRWFVIPRNRFFNVYLHEFRRSDDDRAHHDHPWLFNLSVILWNRYFEHLISRGGIEHRELRQAGDWKLRVGPAPHRVELADGERCLTLFITGPRVREWGFHCARQGWIHWKRFTKTGNAGEIGPGCDA